VFTGLQTGLIEIAFASPVAALVLQWHTKARYITEVPISYSMGVFAIDARAFQALEETDRDVVREVITAITRELDGAARADNARAYEVLQRSGLEPVHVSNADVAGWRQTIEQIFPALRERPDIDAQMFNELLALLREYRAAHPGAAPAE
jgi:TRAP-type C4-dicarboxylate transport system substrate-binding protein